MKKVISSLLVCVMLLSCVLVLASCEKTLAGTYEGTGFGFTTSYTFKGDDVNIKYSAGGFSYSFDGKYEIKDNKITITFEGDNEKANSLEGTFDFEEGDGYIKIGLVKYTKAD